MRALLRPLLITAGIIVGFIFLISAFSYNPNPPEDVSISDVAHRVQEGSVKSILIEGDKLSVTTNDDTELVSTKEAGVSIYEILERAGVTRETIAATSITIKADSGTLAIITNVLPIVFSLLLAVGLFWFLSRQARQGAASAFMFGKSKARLAGMTNSDKKITFKNVAGLIEAKEEVTEVVEFLKDPRKFHKLGARIPRGILLVGSPGTGKTLLAKAVANEANVPFFYVSGSEFVEMFVGVGANRVRDTFETAKQAAPAIIFVDEIDAIGRARGAGIGGGHDEREQTLNQILVEMDGFDTNDAVIIMAATNRPDILDPALLRPGRFDRRIILDEPSLNDRIEVLGIHSVEKPMDVDVNLRVVAERTPGFSGADLANLINEGAILAARKGQKTITQANLLEAIEKVMLGPERRSHVLSIKEKGVTAHHEAGHAIVAAFTEHSDPVHKVSIISRGRAGGYTLKLPSQDKYLRTKKEFEAELAVLLGGYTTEQLVFGDRTTGASNDLKVATDLARRMVTQYGMSEKLGPLVYGETHESIFLGRELMHDRNYSEDVARQIDVEVRAVVDGAMTVAKQILEHHRTLLDRVAATLVEKEVLEQDEFYALIGKPVPTIGHA